MINNSYIIKSETHRLKIIVKLKSFYITTYRNIILLFLRLNILGSIIKQIGCEYLTYLEIIV